MDPRGVFGEFLEENRGGDGAAPARTDVGKVGEGALQAFLVLVIQRHGPHALAFGTGGAQDAVAHGVVVRKDARVDVAERYHNRAGERGRIHQVGATQTARVRQGIGQNETSLGIGIQNLDGFAGHGGDDIAGALGAAAGHVFDAGNEGRHGERRFQLGDGAHGADHGCAAAHIVLHLLHALGGFDGDAAGVEGDALADQAEVRRRSGRGRPVAEDDERGRFGAALRHAEQCAHAEALEVAAFEHLALQALFLSHLARGSGHFQRGEEIGGLVRQRAREVLGFGEHLAAQYRGVEIGGAVRAHHGKRGQRRLVVAGLVAIGFEVTEDGSLDGGRGEFGAGADSLEQHRRRQHLFLFQEADRGGHQLAHFGRVETVGLSGAGQQHARGGGAGWVVQQREFGRLASHFAGVDKWSGAEARFLFSFEDRHNQGAGGNLFGGITFERDFHQL